MSINIQTLSRSGNNPLLKDTARELVNAIMAAVADANDGGHRTLEYELPVSFTTSGISKADSQLIVWTDVICAITSPVAEGGRGFTDVKLKRDSTEKVYLVISWDNGMTVEERQRRLKVLKDAMGTALQCPVQQNASHLQPPPRLQSARTTPVVGHTPVNQHPFQGIDWTQPNDSAHVRSPTMSPLSQWRRNIG